MMFNFVNAKYLMFCNLTFNDSLSLFPLLFTAKQSNMINFYDTEENVYIKPSQRLKKILCVNNFAIKLLLKIHIFLFVTENLTV